MLDYQQPGDPTKHPYQVRLDCGRLIFVPWDEDSVCKKHNPAWWEDLMKREDLSDEQGIQMLTRLSKGKDANARNHEGDSVLHVCLQYRWKPGVETMLSLR